MRGESHSKETMLMFSANSKGTKALMHVPVVIGPIRML